MPIYGLTDREPSFRAFDQIGVLRKGAKKKDDGPGQDLTYFRVEFAEGEEEAAEAFKAAYPEAEPRTINIVLPFDDISRIWEEWREAYRKGALVHRCDGRIIHYALEGGRITVLAGRHVDTGEIMRCTGAPIYTYKNKAGQDVEVKCKPIGRLRVIVRELHRLAYMLVPTGSINDILNISDQLKTLYFINKGRLAGIPLKLKRRPRMVSTPGPNGTRVRRKKWLLTIEAAPEWVEQKMLEWGTAAMPMLQDGTDFIDAEIESVIIRDDDDFDNDDDFSSPEYINNEAEPTDDDSPVPPDVNPDLEALSFNGEDSFHDVVMQEFPCYTHKRHIINYLTQKLGHGWGQNYTKTALFEMLREHAAEKEAVQAAAESGDEPSGETMQFDLDAIPT